MPEFFKSKVGMLLAGLHLLTVLSCLMYVHLIDELATLPLLLAIILTSPWYLILFYFLIPLLMSGVGNLGSEDFILFYFVAMAIGALINAFPLYVLGLLLAKAFKYLSSKMSAS